MESVVRNYRIFIDSLYIAYEKSMGIIGIRIQAHDTNQTVEETNVPLHE
jgi:hypothetical protein